MRKVRKAPPTSSKLPSASSPSTTVNGSPSNALPLPAMPPSSDGPAAAINRPIGVSGLKRPQWRGTLYEEFLPELSGRRAVRVYREMSDNDAIVGAVLFIIDSTIRKIEWTVKGGNEQSAEFLQSCIDDMNPNFGKVVSEILSMLTYGWSWFEKVYKRRQGYASDPALSSKFKDGRIGWQSWQIRSQDSMSAWQWDNEGRMNAMIQQAPPDFAEHVIPLSRSLHFTTSIHKQNPEGRSLLRNAYRSWIFRRNIETIEAIGAERDAAGMPVIYRHPTYQTLDETDFKPLLRNIKRDEQEGIIVPLVYDEQGHKLIELELLRSAGARQIDLGSVIERKGREIAMTMVSDFVMMGHESVGSLALSESKTDMFLLAMEAVLKNIAETINEDAVPDLFALNGMPVDDLPYLTYGKIKAPDLGKIGAYIQTLSGAGMPLFPDPELEDHLRDIGDLPEKSEDAMRMQEEDRMMQAEERQTAMESARMAGGQGDGGTGNTTE